MQIDALRFNAVYGLIALFIGLIATIVLALSIGRYEVPITHVSQILLAQVGWFQQSLNTIEQQVIVDIRLPRVLLAGIIGAGLALAGAALQSLLRNPLADPQILGVSSGAAFGGVLAILVIAEGWPFIVGAFIFGLLALVMVFWLAGGLSSQNGTLMLVLAGLVVSALFSAGVSLIKFVADPQNELPAIVYWLLGSLAGANYDRLQIAAPFILFGILIIFALRFHLSALSMGEQDAKSLGVPVTKVKLLTLLAVGLIVAAAVAASGIIGWVGLVIPHLVRLAFGANHKTFFFSVATLGALYLILVDTLARSVTTAEIPLGALTALIGAPIFAMLLVKLRKTGHA